MIGRRLSHYRIEERLGAGGMGEVYRARDEKLGRDVALKVLPAGALCDESARRRFQKEAEALSRLSHPHVATLLDFDQADGVDFLVMELVVGPTLEQEVRKGPLAEKDVVRLGAQLARGLVAAHERGVVHRDLKPANLQLTADGMLKILDFGVAHLERAGAARAPSETATETAAGDVLGSPPYMAPEQLLGRPVDARTDVYAAGACLYELATGSRPYDEKRGAELTEAILHQEPKSPRAVHGAVSPGLEAVIRKALDKEPGLRYQTARELLVDLERLQAGGASPSTSVSTRFAVAWRRWLWLSAAGALAVVGAVAWRVGEAAPPRLVDVRPVTSGLSPSTMITPLGYRSWATDGSRLYFVGMKDGRSALLQVPVTGGEPAEIPVPFRSRMNVFGYARRQSAVLMGGSEEAAGESSIAVNPDGFPLWMTPVTTGVPRRVGNLLALEAALSRDGEWIALLQSNRIQSARSDGTRVRLLTQLSTSYSSGGLRWSPDGRALRYTAPGPGAEGSSGGGDWIWEVASEGGPAKALWPGVSGDWSSDGAHYFFLRRNAFTRRFDIWAVRERPWLPWPRPRPERFTLGPLEFKGVGPSLDGRRLYSWGLSLRGELQGLDLESGRFKPYLGGLSAADVATSADGRWLAWVAFPEGTLWRGRADGSDRLQLTTAPLSAYLPRFSPDGQRIVFVGRSPQESGNSVRVVPLGGGEPEILALPSSRVVSWWDVCWLPDGRSVVSSSMSLRQPGLFRIDARTREVSPLLGAERLVFPKCRWQGGILAFEPPSAGSAGRTVVFWPEQKALGPVVAPLLWYLNWTRDGKAIIGHNLARRRVERFSFDTRRSKDVADTDGIPLEGPNSAPWMGLAPDDTPLILRSHDTWELYALEWDAP